MNPIALLRRLEDLGAGLLPYWLASLALRVGLAVPFFRSGITKWDGFLKLNDTDILLFTDEFKLHVFGKVYDYPYPAVMAYLSALGETILPVLLVIGLFTRLSGLGLLLMTALIQLTIPTGWPIHITWVAMAAGVIALGPGRLSLDGAMGRSY